jgi:hypothetical protein
LLSLSEAAKKTLAAVSLLAKTLSVRAKRGKLITDHA